MRIVMTLLVRDEADIVADMLDVHFALGVDHVIATDNLSVDGTDAILARYADEGRLTLRRETDDTYAQARWVSAMARSAATDHGADWVINADADEFWLPCAPDGTVTDLRTALADVPDDVGVIQVRRWNFVARDADQRPWHERMRWRYADTVNHEGAALAPKVLHRAHPEAQVFMGNHWVEHDAGATLADDCIQLLHFPLRSYEQLVGKVLKGGTALENNDELDPALGIGWRTMLTDHREGRFEQQWRSWVPTDEALAAAVADGSVVEDRRVADLISGLVTPAAGPTTPSRAAGAWRDRLRAWRAGSSATGAS